MFLDTAHMLAEEANFEGAHFAHIVTRNEVERRKLIDRRNREAYAAFERRKGPRRMG